MPAVEFAERPVVLLRLRGREEVGSTFIQVIARYALSLKARQGKLVLVGVSEPVYHQLEKTGLLRELEHENVYRGTSILGDASLKAYQDAVSWLEQAKAS